MTSVAAKAAAGALRTAVGSSVGVARAVPTHASFELLRTEYVAEYDLTCAMYKHTRSGAEVLSVLSDDGNKVFGANFRTPPKSDNGIAHIMEHSVLCGSRKFTSKEPFVELLKGSLQTFLNAFTYPDRTCYPVASQNTKDFYSLVHVYMDAVFHPRAVRDEMVLKQEGWHYEVEKLPAGGGGDAAAAAAAAASSSTTAFGPLTYKGVVFNEMKGVYSSPDALLARAALREIFPNNAYSVDSGGDPLTIPELSFEEFKAFHREYYHPSNARIFFAGNDDPAERLVLLDEYLSEFTLPATGPIDTAVRVQPIAGSTPWRSTDVYPVSAGEEDAGDVGGDAVAAAQKSGAALNEKGRHMVTLNWVLHEAELSSKERLALNILDHILVGTTTAPLYQALLSSGLGTAVVGGGLSDELLQASFAIGMKGVKGEDVDGVEALVLSTLRDVAKDGVHADALAASMNSIEFVLREFNTGSFPRGLSVMLTALQEWNYGRDPIEALRFEDTLAELKKDLAEGRPVFEEMVKSMLLENGHRVTLTMKPDEGLEARLLAEEEAMLDTARAALDEEGLNAVAMEMETLQAAQLAEDSPEDLATIPALSIADLSRGIVSVGTEARTGFGGIEVLEHEETTSGILYADVALDAAAISSRLLPVLPLFARAIFNVGTSNLSDAELQRRVGTHTGGMGGGLFSSMRAAPESGVSNPSELDYKMLLRGKTTMEGMPQFWDLARDVLTDARLDHPERIVEMLKASNASMESAMISSGNSLAASRLAAGGSLAGYVAERTGGVSYGDSLQEQLVRATNDWPSLLSDLEEVRAALLDSLRRGDAQINLTADRATLDAAAPWADAFVAETLAAAPSAPAPATATTANKTGVAAWNESWSKDFATAATQQPRSEGFAVTTQVNYVTLGGQLFAPGERVSGATSVVQRWLSRGFLWDNVRVVGGAYGGSCTFSPYSGRILFSSYRDPNLEGTIDTYFGAAEQLAGLSQGGLSEEALTQAIVGAVGDLDTPMTAEQRGGAAFRWRTAGETDESRQQWRDEVLSTTAKDFEEFGERLRSVFDANQVGVAVFGSSDSLQRARDTLAESRGIDLNIRDMNSKSSAK